MTFWKGRMPRGALGVGEVTADDDGAARLDAQQIGIGDGDGTDAAGQLGVVQVRRGGVLQIGPGKRREAARGGALRPQGHLRVHEHVVDEPLHAVGRQGLEVLPGREPPGLPLHVGQGADEQHAPAALADGLHDARDQQVRDDGGEQRAGPEHDEVGLADGLAGRLVGARRPAVLGGEPYRLQGRTRMAGHSLAVEHAPILGTGRQHHMIQGGGVHVPLGVHEPLADGDGLGERPAGIFQSREQKIAQGVVAGHGEAVLQRPHQRIGRVLGEGHKALADVAGGRGVGLFPQHAGASAVIGHGHHRTRLHAQRQQGANGHRGARAAADDHGAQGPVALVQAAQVRQGALQGREGRRGRRVHAEGVGFADRHGPTRPFGRRHARPARCRSLPARPCRARPAAGRDGPR